MRGFLKETASLVAWIVAAAVTYFYVFNGTRTRSWGYVAKLPTSTMLIAVAVFVGRPRGHEPVGERGGEIGGR